MKLVRTYLTSLMLLNSGCGTYVAMRPDPVWTPVCPNATDTIYDQVISAPAAYAQPGKEHVAVATATHIRGCLTRDGLRTGLWFTRNDNWDETQVYVEGRRHGPYRSVFVTVSTAHEVSGYYEDDQKHGVFVERDLLGGRAPILSRTTYVHGARVGNDEGPGVR